jgi:Putative phage serine protease XkdF
MLKQLPIYEMRIDANEDSDLQVDFVALVDKPAIEKLFMAFNEQPQKQMFAVTNEDKHIVSGALMIADKLIYRNDDNGEYYVKFDAQTIQDIAIKFAKKGFQNNVNIMHDANQQLQGVTMFESFISDSERGIAPMKGFEDVANGSWFGSFYVDNNEVWQQIKDGKFQGFSVEGLFNYKPIKYSIEEALKQIENILVES